MESGVTSASFASHRFVGFLLVPSRRTTGNSGVTIVNRPLHSNPRLSLNERYRDITTVTHWLGF